MPRPTLSTRRVLWGALWLASGCLGSIEEKSAAKPSGQGAPTAGPDAAGPAPISPAPNAPPPPDVFTFDCPQSPTGDGRVLRRLSKPELRAHLTNVLDGTSLGTALPTRVGALIATVPDEPAGEGQFPEEELHTSEGHVSTLIDLAQAGGALVASLTARDLDLLSGAACGTPTTCARGLADELGLRLFRRPMTDAEVTRLAEHLMAAGGTTTAERVAAGFTYLFLQPASLLHLEEQPSTRLSAFEAMNRVHFGLLGTPAPVALLKQLRAGGWTRAKAEQRIDEILASAPFRARVRSFFQTWLGFGPDVDLGALPAAMTMGLVAKEVPGEAYRDVRAFLEKTVFERKGTFNDLLLSTEAYDVGPNLAKIYGVQATPTPATPTTMVALDPERHLGLLGRVSMNLYGTPQTSPIARGVRVKRKLLCEDIHPPPNVNLDDAGSVPIDDPNKYPNRFLVENKTRPAPCRACHVSIDSIGFALDFYDSIGRYRTEEQRFAAGKLVATFPLSTDIDLQVLPGKLIKASGPASLAREIAATEMGSACFVSQWLAFTSQLNRYDTGSCLKRSLHQQVARGGGGMLEMFRRAALAQLDAWSPAGGRP